MKPINSKILDFYLQYSTYTNPGCYKEFLQSLPNEINELGYLVCHQIIHRITLRNGNTGANAGMKYGDMTKFPWYRLRCEDDVLMTAVSMIAELLRLDERGFVKDRAVENKIVVTCRYVSILMSAILKAKGIPARSRSGFSPYCSPGSSGDHWINQYWSEKEERWITFDAEGFYNLAFDQFDIPDDRFDWAAKTWLDIRHGNTDGKQFVYGDGKGINGLKAVIRAIFYDFHALMNYELSYKFQPRYINGKFDTLTETDFQEIDELALIMIHPENNFLELKEVWDTKKKFRLINSPLIGDNDHV
ncbi:MAG: transglutaminase domain-containing protein [Bacteroidetes bacterium]|nr:transglutaminase domain-containing protein [Bacteroidales bacterium]NJO70143.1 transglutaminase domain-containing protein [Bacteroidota bacterium]